MLILPTNTSNFITRVIIVLVIPILLYAIINAHFKGGFTVIVGFFGFAFLEVIFVLSLLAINNVEIDTDNNIITFNSLFNSKIYPITAITNYNETFKRNAIKEFYGILVSLNDGTEIQIAGQNVNGISELKSYLNEKGIPGGEQQKMRFPFN